MSILTNTANEPFSVDDGLQSPGTICLANESRFNATHYSEPLTSFTIGWRDPENLQELLDFIAPPVMVGRRFEFKKAINSEAFLSESDDVRAIGSGFKRVEYGGESVNEKTHNKGLTIRVDHDDEVGDDWRERYVQLLLQRLYRNELRRAVAQLDNAATNSAKTWNQSSNPDGDIRTALVAATNVTGVRPNRAVFGESAWDIRGDAYDMQDTAGAYRSAGLAPDELARKLFLDGVRVLAARYQANQTTKQEIIGNRVYLFNTRSGMLKDEPANIKRFVTPTDGGSSFRVYVEEHSKYTDITVEHYSNIVITSASGIHKLTVNAE